MHLEKLGINKEGLEKDREHLKTPYSPNKKKAKTQNNPRTDTTHPPLNNMAK